MQMITTICASLICTLLLIIIEYRRSNATLAFWKKLFLLISAQAGCSAGCIMKEYSIANILFTVFLVSGLYVLSIEDLETRTVPSVFLNIMIMAGAVCTLINITDGGAGRIIIFCLIFIVLFTAAKKEKLGIGTGDAKVIAATALFIYPGTLFVALFMSLFIAMIYGIFILARKKSGIKTELPFIPFLLAGTVISLLS